MIIFISFLASLVLVDADWASSKIVEELPTTTAAKPDTDGAQCVDKYCFEQQECCPGAVCFTHSSSNVGLCVKSHHREEGKVCNNDRECAVGLVCKTFVFDRHPFGICIDKTKSRGKTNLGDHCETSYDCNLDNRMCCRWQKPMTSEERTICSYFDDPLQECIF